MLLAVFASRSRCYLFIALSAAGFILFLSLNIFFRPESYSPFNYSPLIVFNLFSIWISIIRRKRLNQLFLLLKTIDEQQTKLEKLALHDSLTGLCNRHYLDEFINFQISFFERSKIPFTIAFLDLDNFKQINDTFGHKEGDKVLKQVAGIIQEETRTSDVAARYGGDEFVLLLVETKAEQGKLLCRRIQERIGEINNRIETPSPLGVSIGLTEIKHGETLKEILQRADKLMYYAKSSGKNRLSVDN